MHATAKPGYQGLSHCYCHTPSRTKRVHIFDYPRLAPAFNCLEGSIRAETINCCFWLRCFFPLLSSPRPISGPGGPVDPSRPLCAFQILFIFLPFPRFSSSFPHAESRIRLLLHPYNYAWQFHSRPHGNTPNIALDANTASPAHQFHRALSSPAHHVFQRQKRVCPGLCLLRLDRSSLELRPLNKHRFGR